MDKKALLAE